LHDEVVDGAKPDIEGELAIAAEGRVQRAIR